MTPSTFDPAANGWTPYRDEGFVDLVGPLWLSPSEPDAMGFVAQSKHANLIGVVQGGMLMTFGDRAMGLSAWRHAGDRPCVTIQFDMHFVSSARIGEFVVAVPELVRRTRSLFFMQGRVMVADRVVATATGIWKLLEQKGSSPTS